jgi:hypothetical protein
LVSLLIWKYVLAAASGAMRNGSLAVRISPARAC